MIYLSWAVLYEGTTDQAYFDVLIPRLMEELTRLHGTRTVIVPSGPTIVLHRRDIEQVAREACEAREAFHLMFVHADTGGRELEADVDARSLRYCEAMHAICMWPPQRCIAVMPRHETEAWMLGDSAAIADALGYRGNPSDLGLPSDAEEAERLPDPKQVLRCSAGQSAWAAATGRYIPDRGSLGAASVVR